LGSFEDARDFARRLKLKSANDWREYCRSDRKPADIPDGPHKVYAQNGWTSWGDWLGTDTVSTSLRPYRSFKKARAFVRGLGLKSQSEWRDYTRSGKKPVDIPANPEATYKKVGWAGMGDWLGTGRIADQLREFRPFKKSRAFVHDLKLKSFREWFDYCRLGRKPFDIPSNPQRAYKNDGWCGWGDWLGTGNVSQRLREFRPFTNARAFTRSLGLKSGAEWRDYSTSGKKPADIPANPGETYKEVGWAGMGDWLGTGRVADQWREYRPFKEARTFVHGLGLKSNSEWRASSYSEQNVRRSWLGRDG
jgi:hypothetical protein